MSIADSATEYRSEWRVIKVTSRLAAEIPEQLRRELLQVEIFMDNRREVHACSRVILDAGAALMIQWTLIHLEQLCKSQRRIPFYNISRGTNS
jgi:hypothetical protein